MIHYLPSCKVKAIHPQASNKIQKYLADQGVNIVGCCRVSQSLFQPGDTVLNNCTSCAIITQEQSPEVKGLSLYEYLLADSHFPWPDFKGEKITVQDCYRSIGDPEMQHAIRKCLEKMNMVPVEIEENYEKTRFDGTFKYALVSEANKKLAPIYYPKFEKEFVEVKEEAEMIQELKEHVRQYTTQRVVCYCNGCYKGLKLGGADAVHIIDLLTANL